MPYFIEMSHTLVVADRHSMFLWPHGPAGPIAKALRYGVLTDELRPQVPTTATVKMNEPGASITHMMPHGLSSTWVLHMRLVQKLEDLEPGVHEFLPIEVKDETNDVTYADEYRLLILSQTIECFDLDPTRWRTIQNDKFGPSAAKDAQYMPTQTLENPIYLRLETVEGLHLWRGGAGIRAQLHLLFGRDCGLREGRGSAGLGAAHVRLGGHHAPAANSCNTSTAFSA